MTRHTIWLVQFSLIAALFLGASAAFSLTPEEVLKLKAAGVSETTIQLMLQKEPEDKIPSRTLEQGYATEHMGTWKLQDGRTITSTGKRQLPLDYPTAYPPDSPYAPNIYPYVVSPPPEGQHKASAAAARHGTKQLVPAASTSSSGAPLPSSLAPTPTPHD
jgi:hypothetical protein